MITTQTTRNRIKLYTSTHIIYHFTSLSHICTVQQHMSSLRMLFYELLVIEDSNSLKYMSKPALCTVKLAKNPKHDDYI